VSNRRGNVLGRHAHGRDVVGIAVREAGALGFHLIACGLTLALPALTDSGPTLRCIEERRLGRSNAPIDDIETTIDPEFMGNDTVLGINAGFGIRCYFGEKLGARLDLLDNWVCPVCGVGKAQFDPA